MKALYGLWGDRSLLPGYVLGDLVSRLRDVASRKCGDLAAGTEVVFLDLRTDIPVSCVDNLDPPVSPGLDELGNLIKVVNVVNEDCSRLLEADLIRDFDERQGKH